MIVCDDTFYPVIITHWQGPYSPEVLDDYFAQQEALAGRAERDGTWLVLVTWGGDAPSSAERRYIVERTHAMPENLQQRTICSLIVAENAVLRGVITAFRWLLGDSWSLTLVADLDQVVAHARRVLDDKQVPFPRELTVEALERAMERDLAEAV